MAPKAEFQKKGELNEEPKYPTTSPWSFTLWAVLAVLPAGETSTGEVEPAGQ
jgi:hypothetical protein